MKILLAVDSSPASEVAVQQIAARPWPANTAIEVLHVVEPPLLWTAPEIIDEPSHERAMELVQRVAERLHGVPVVLSGDPKSVIVDRAKETGADFVVVGPHGTRGLTRFLLGSVAQAVVRSAPCSVEVARGAPSQGAIKVLLATDGSEFSLAAARSVAARPWPAGTEVKILSVVELALSPLQAALEPPFVDTAAMETLRVEGMKRAQNAIASAEEIVTTAGLKASEALSVLVDGARQIILDEALQWGADLIVVGSHGHRGIDRFLLGSVSEAVAMHAECSVEVIRRTV